MLDACHDGGADDDCSDHDHDDEGEHTIDIYDWALDDDLARDELTGDDILSLAFFRADLASGNRADGVEPAGRGPDNGRPQV